MLGNQIDYISHYDALLKIERYTLDEGKAAGTPMIRVENTKGLALHIAAGRSLDITELRYRGTPLNFFSGTGITHAAYYNAQDEEWLRSFFAGFLTTCGLDQVGDPSQFGNKRYGMHGRISNCPAEHVSIELKEDNGRLRGCVSGQIRQAMHQGENLILRRKLLFNSEETAFVLSDEITNHGSSKSPFMILYHFNLGYPFLSESTTIELPINNTWGWNDSSEKRKEEYNRFYPPKYNREDLTLLHNLQPDDDGNVSIDISNNGIRLRMTYNIGELPILGQWKHLVQNDYVMGIEPCNNNIKGIGWEAQNRSLVYLEPKEKKVISIRIDIKE